MFRQCLIYMIKMWWLNDWDIMFWVSNRAALARGVSFDDVPSLVPFLLFDFWLGLFLFNVFVRLTSVNYSCHNFLPLGWYCCSRGSHRMKNHSRNCIFRVYLLCLYPNNYWIELCNFVLKLILCFSFIFF